MGCAGAGLGQARGLGTASEGCGAWGALRSLGSHDHPQWLWLASDARWPPSSEPVAGHPHPSLWLASGGSARSPESVADQFCCTMISAHM